MARDHRVGLGTPYTECAICAKTIRQSEAIMQRGFLVGPECYDDLGASGEDPAIGGFIYQWGDSEYGVLTGYDDMAFSTDYGEITDIEGGPVSTSGEYGVITEFP